MTDSKTFAQDEPAEGGKGTPPPGIDSPRPKKDEGDDTNDNLPPEKVNPLAPPVNIEPGS